MSWYINQNTKSDPENGQPRSTQDIKKMVEQLS